MNFGAHFLDRVTTNHGRLLIDNLRRSQWKFADEIILFELLYCRGWLHANLQHFITAIKIRAGFVILILFGCLVSQWQTICFINCILSNCWLYFFSSFDNIFARLWKITIINGVLFEILYLIELFKNCWDEEAVGNERHHNEAYSQNGTVHTTDVSQQVHNRIDLTTVNIVHWILSNKDWSYVPVFFIDLVFVIVRVFNF